MKTKLKRMTAWLNIAALLTSIVLAGTVNLIPVAADFGDDGGTYVVSAWLDSADPKIVHLEFSGDVTDSGEGDATTVTKYTLMTSSEDAGVNPSAVTLDPAMTTEVLLDFNSTSVTTILVGMDGHSLAVSGTIGIDGTDEMVMDFTVIEGTFDDDGGFFGPPVVINEVNISPAQDWSGETFSYDSENPNPGASNVDAVDQYIELRMNNVTPDSSWTSIKDGDNLDLTKLVIYVYDSNWDLKARCHLQAAGASGCAANIEGYDGIPKFNNVYYSGTFGTPANADLLVVGNGLSDSSSLAGIAGGFQVEVRSSGMEDMIVAEVAFGTMNGMSDWNAPAPNSGSGNDEEAVGLDDIGTAEGPMNDIYTLQHASPQVDNLVTATFEVMGVSPCGTTELCVDFNRAVDSSTLGTTNFSLYDNSSSPATLVASPTITGVFRESEGGGRFVQISLSAALTANTPYDLRILGGNTGVKDTDGNLLTDDGVACDYDERGFLGFESDTDAPEPTDVNVMNPREIEVLFNENNCLDISAMDMDTYTDLVFSPSLTVSNAWSNCDGLQIQFSEDMTAGQTYVLTITDLKDSPSGGGAGNTLVSPNNTISFSGIDTSDFDDGQPPNIWDTSPYDWQWEVPRNSSNFQIMFSEAMDSSTLTASMFSLKVWDESTGIASTEVSIGTSVSYSSNTYTATVSIDETLAASTGYEIKILGGANGVKDMSGSQLIFDNYYSYFFTSAGLDTTKPTVIFTSADNNTSDFAVGGGFITIYFDESMDPATIDDNDPTDSGSNITLSSSSSGTTTYISGNVVYYPGDMAAEYHIGQVLNPNTSYTLTVTTDVTDVAGNALASQTTRSITTGGADTSSPEVNFVDCDGFWMWIQFSKGVNSTEATKKANYSITMGGSAVDTSGLQFEYFPFEQGVEIRGFSGSPNDAYAITISDVTDMTGNTLSPNPFTFSGVVFDPNQFMSSLFVFETSPMWDEWDVPINIKTLSAFFSDELDSSTVTTSTVGLYADSDSSFATNLCNSVSYLTANEAVACNLTADLTANTRYIFKVGHDDAASSIKDANNNSFPFPMWVNFETGSGSDATPPTIDWTEPPDGDTSISVGVGRVSVFFAEDMDPTSFTSSTVKLYPTASGVDGALAGNREFHPMPRVMDFFPDAALTASTEYTMQLTTGVKDRQGNALASATTFAFTTGGEDTTDPSLDHVSGTNWDLWIKFSEPVNEDLATSLRNYNLEVYDTSTSAWESRPLEGKTIEYHPFDNSVFIMGLNLNNGDQFRVTVSNVTDIVGNTIDSTNNPFTGTVADMTYFEQGTNVMFSNPGPGMWDVPVNTPWIEVGFSSAISSSTVDNTTFQLFEHVCDGWSCQDGTALTTGVAASNYGYNDDSNTAYLDLSAASITLSADTEYHVVLTTGITDANGNNLQSFDMFGKGNLAYDFFFHTNWNSDGDLSSPQIWGTSLDQWESGGSITGVPMFLWGIDIPFDKQMSESLITDLNAADSGSNIYVKKNSDSSKVAGQVEYDFPGRRAMWLPTEALEGDETAYTLVVETDITDHIGNALETQFTQIFTTASTASDTLGPFIGWAEADPYGVSIYFSEPVNKTKAENIRNYTIESGADVASLVAINLESKDAEYVAFEQAVNIDGLALSDGNVLRITVSNKVLDLAGNAMVITQDTANDDSTGGSPTVEYDPMAPRSVDGTLNNFNEFELYVAEHYDEYFEVDNWTDDQMVFDKFGGAMAHPENPQANATTAYFVDVPLFASVPVGGKIEIKFPEGWDVTSADSMPVFTRGASDAMMSPVNGDINGPGPGTVTIASTAANKAARTVTIVTGGAATQTSDFITYDLIDIKNGAASDTGMKEKKATITTYNASNVKLEGPIYSQPIFIEPRGTGTVTITVNVDGLGEGVTVDDDETIRIHLGSMFGGHNEESATFSGGSATATFSNLREGDYHVFAEPYMTVNVDSTSTEFFGASMGGEGLYLSEGGTATKTLTILAADGDTFDGNTMYEVTITATGGPANEKVDVEIFNMMNWFMKEATFDGSGELSLTMKVPGGFYMAAVRPWMPKGFFMGPPPAMTFMEPREQEIYVDGTDDSINFSIQTNDYYVKIYVKDSTADENPIPNAHVFLMNVDKFGGFGGGMGGDTGQDGSVTIQVAPGEYEADVHLPGQPPFPRQEVSVTESNTSGNPATMTFKAYVPDLKISGTLTRNNLPVSYAPVFANKVDSNGDWLPVHLNRQTDGSGNYEFFVDASTSWVIGAWFPGYGEVTKSVTVASANMTGQNISVSDNDFVTVTGTLTYGESATALSDGMVFAESIDDTYHVFNDVHTKSDGTFKIKLKKYLDANQTVDGLYSLGVYQPEIGGKIFYNSLDLTNETAGGTKSIATQAVTTGDIGDVTIAFVDAAESAYVIDEGFIDCKSDTTGAGNFIEIRGLSSKTVKLEKGAGYECHGFVPEVGELTAQTDITVGDSTTVTFTISNTKVTITGTVTDGSSGVSQPKVRFFNAETGFQRSVTAAADGTYSISVPPSQTYLVTAKKKGYLPMAPTDLVVATTNLTGQDYALTAENQSVVISGSVLLGSAAATGNAKVVAINTSDGTFISKKTDELGNYSLPVKNGDWEVKVYSDGYEIPTSEDVTVSGAAQTSVDFTLSEDANYTNTPPKIASVLPSSGGKTFFKDADIDLEVTIPAGALGDESQNNYQVSLSKTSELVQTGSAKPVLSEGIEFTVTDDGGIPVTEFDQPIKFEYDYSADADDLTSTQIDKMALNAMSSSDNAEWEPISCVNDDTNYVLTCTTSHTTIFGTVTAGDAVPPSAPTNLAGTGSDGSVALDWDDNSEGDLLEYEVYRSTTSGFTPADANQINTSSVTTSAYTDSDVTNGTTYYYSVKAVDSSGNYSSAATEASATPESSSSDDDDSTPTPTYGGGGGGTPPPNIDAPGIDELEDPELIDIDELEEELKLPDMDEIPVSPDLGELPPEAPEPLTSFNDAYLHWGETYIGRLYDKGVIQGFSETTFGPDYNITRAQLTKITLATFEIPLAEIDENPFSDVDKDMWYAPYIAKAKELGFLDGYADGTFKPDQYVNRAEAMKIILKAAGVALADEADLLAALGLSTNPFPDVDLGAWYSKYVLYGYKLGIISGYDDGTFGPGNSMTRAEFTKVAVNTYDTLVNME